MLPLLTLSILNLTSLAGFMNVMLVSRSFENLYKIRFWQNVIGYERPEAIRDAILQQITPQDAYGKEYTAIILVAGQLRRSRETLTALIVLNDENIARFVTSVPQRKR